MPDFDQKQAGWVDAGGNWSHCGPVAVADSLWWFDSEYEPLPVPPPNISDNYPMVTSYNPGVWDDHDTQNVVPLVNDIAWWVDCDGIRTGIPQSGTNVTNMQCGIDNYLIMRNLYGPYYERTVPAPNLSFIMDEVERCEDLVLLLGFWQENPYEGWVRIGGHYVTTAGFDRNSSQLAFSDPMFDNAEAGGPGRVPVAHPFPHGGGIHNDAQYVSHDAYTIVPSFSPGGNWAVQNYAVGKNISQFFGMNWNPNTTPPIPWPYNASLPVNTEIEYAIDVSPKPNISDVVESVWEWHNKSDVVSVGLHLFNESWNDTIFDAELLFWSDWTCTQWVWDNWLPNGSLNYCQWQWINASWPYSFPPEIVVVHYSDINGSNIGFTFSEEWEEPLPTPTPTATPTETPGP